MTGQKIKYKEEKKQKAVSLSENDSENILEQSQSAVGRD